MIVTVIGLSAVAVIRLEARAAVEERDLAQAAHLAFSSVEHALLTLDDTADWRTGFTHGVAAAEHSLAPGTFYWVLKDPDGDLADDDTDPVRLYGIGQVGDVARVSSVQLEPSPEIVGANLLSNAEMENGVSGWSPFPSPSSCALQTQTDAPHGGGQCLQALNREVASGPSQDITASLTNGATYDSSIWVKMQEGQTRTVQVTIHVDSTGNGEASFSFTVPGVGDSWTHVSGTLTLAWSGTLNGARWSISTLTGNEQFDIDDASLVEVLCPAGKMQPIAGTWRWDQVP